MTTAPGTTITAPRELVSASMFDRLTRRVMVDHGTDQTAAEQVTDQALAFLQACALDPAAGLAPSPPGSTRAGTRSSCTPPTTPNSASASPRPLHPPPACRARRPGDDGAASHATVTAMRAAGLPVDIAPWPASADCDSKCHQCHSGCHDSPKRA